MKTRVLRNVVGALVMAAVVCAVPSYAAKSFLDVQIDKPVFLVSGERTAYLKITLHGVETAGAQRAPANVAIVLDRSGSMQGEKLRRAKEAAIQAINRLSPEDIVSVIAYDDTVRVLLPATRASDLEAIREALLSVEAGGSTALFAGVSKGVAEIRKFLDRRRVNRIILLSDGIANVGPSSPNELGNLGASLKKEGISVSTIGLGLGYNEDLMSRLADRSDGNHAFVEHPSDLARIFDHEFGDVLSVTAKEVLVRINCGDGVRPVRVLGRDAEIVGSSVIATVNQIYGGNDKYVLLELEMPTGRAGQERPVATVAVDYLDVGRGRQTSESRNVAVRYSEDRASVERSIDSEVMVAVVEQIANERNEAAVTLRDQGRISEAEALLLENAYILDESAARLKSEKLKDLAATNRNDSENLDDKNWESQRKMMRGGQQMLRQQQSAPPPTPAPKKE